MGVAARPSLPFLFCLMRFDDPVVLFKAAVAAYARRDLETFAGCFDAGTLERVRREAIESVRRERPPMTVEDILRDAPDMPREAAAYHLAQVNQNSSREAMLKSEYDVSSVEELEALPVAEFLFRMIDVHSYRRQLQRLFERRGQPMPDAVVPEQHFHVIGWLPDGDSIGHILYRPEVTRGPHVSDEWLEQFPEDERAMATELAVRGHHRSETCIRQPDGGWKLAAQHSIFGSGQMMVVGVREE